MTINHKTAYIEDIQGFRMMLVMAVTVAVTNCYYYKNLFFPLSSYVKIFSCVEEKILIDFN